MKRLTAICGSILALALTAVPALAAPNPNGTGQPSQSCQAEPTGPPGLLSTTNGFARIAVNVYAVEFTTYTLTISQGGVTLFTCTGSFSPSPSSNGQTSTPSCS